MKSKDLVLLMLVAVLAAGVQATTYVWQGGDGNWGDANWTVDGTADQQALDDEGDDYINYAGDTFTVTGGTISKLDSTGDGGLTKLQKGSVWNQSGGTLIINETGAWSHGITAFGHLPSDGNPDVAVVMNLSGTARIEATRTTGNNNKAAMNLDGANLTMTDSASLSLDGGPGLGLILDNNVTLTMRDNASISATDIKFNIAGSTDTFFKFESGTITLSNSNPLKTPSLGSGNEPSNRLDFLTVNGAGAAVLIHTDNTNAGTTLASKMATGFMCIDGVIVNDVDTVVNGYKFQIDTNGTTDTLSLVVPEPATLVLLGLGSFLGFRKRVKK